MYSHGDTLSRGAAQNTKVEDLAWCEALVRECSALKGNGAIAVCYAGGLGYWARNGDPVRNVLVHGEAARTQPVVLVQVGLVSDLDQVEHYARVDDGWGIERLDDRPCHVDCVRDVVSTKINTPCHVRSARQEAGELVEAITYGDAGRFREWGDSVWRRKLSLFDSHGRREKGVVLRVSAYADFRRPSSECGIVLKDGMHKVVARVGADPRRPIVLLYGKRYKGGREILSTRRR